MKLAYGIAVTLAVISSSAFARRGDNNDSRFPVGSPEWVSHESLEHSMRLLPLGTSVTGTSVQLVSETSSTVAITVADGSTLNFGCEVVEEWSRHNTVLKKEVRCSLQ